MSLHTQIYLAWQLSRLKGIDDADKFTGVLSEAKVDLNPHQIEAALFAFKNPLSKGALLADEVGLGKTIEAGIVISQHWAQHHRRILIVCPASLRRQWAAELEEKFYLPTKIIEGSTYKQLCSTENPFDDEGSVLICSYHFVKSKAKDIQEVPWHLVVLDEAHKLRNVYKKGAIMAQEIRRTLHGCKKLLLSATPLQNNIQELYGLISVINHTTFGSNRAFNHKYGHNRLSKQVVLDELKDRIKPLVHRTLRKHVMEYVKYTKRIPICQVYTSNTQETELYNVLSSYLQREALYALPNGQRTLITLVLRKQMASSSFAVVKILTRFIDRLELMAYKQQQHVALEVNEWEDYMGSDAEGWEEEVEGQDTDDTNISGIEEEIKELKGYRDLALSIQQDTKGTALLDALKKGFEHMAANNAPHKALIFTESKETQKYLVKLLEANGYLGKVACFNGDNTSEESKAIYERWKKKPQNAAKITQVKAVDIRHAIVDYFKEEATILIATEAASEGINLQFCSLVVNYDMPWNPQRVEQRIGRCHRYGQKHDVVVVSFTNKSNAADQRVYELLNEKFKLFDGVFGASDEILGAIESGVDFEKRLLHIFQSCRSKEEINTAFDALQEELEDVIKETMAKAKLSLLENFDQDVVEKLRFRHDENQIRCSKFQRQLFKLIVSHCKQYIDYIDEDRLQFNLSNRPYQEINMPIGKYAILNQDSAQHLRISHPLAQHIIHELKESKLIDQHLSFTYDRSNGIMSLIENKLGTSGYLSVQIIRCKSTRNQEEHIVVSVITEGGEVLPSEFGDKLLNLPNKPLEGYTISDYHQQKITEQNEKQSKNIIEDLSNRHDSYIETECEILEDWGDDQLVEIREEISELVKQKGAIKRASRKAKGKEKLDLTRQYHEVKRKHQQKVEELHEQQDLIEEQVEQKLDELESSLQHEHQVTDVFTIKWSLQ